ncbi:ECF RNA polymerase sigma factor SigE [Rubrobacter xylanophilus DSM 9941]|uniref:RNA polymerase sigma factor n=1 Tax=Rubrobacter xylanophilus TaxID=49319 RepID=UPI001C642DB6|nr:RNA polymerase sigma factor [Rubrobacter xylanophilus]QYJ14224.1 ECF RNA polymerase sigma factor SigE [Rubrobacter xylanophilus DSM 9941]
MAGLSNAINRSKKLSDEALVARAQSGDRRAFSELVRRHESSVYRVCYRVLGNREDAKDAAQEAFVRAFRKLESFEGRSSFKTWLLRLTMNVSLNERAKNHRELPQKILESGYEPGPDKEVSRSEMVARLHKALQVLGPNHRAAVVLRDLEGLSYIETAEALGVNEGTAKSWVHRGRQRLRDLIT